MKKTLLLIGFALLTLAGIFGIPSWPRSETPIGYFTISKNPYGIAIYQGGRHASVQFENAGAFEVKGMTATIAGPAHITYSRDDIIFDATGTLYTEPKQEEIDYVAATLGKSFIKIGTSDRKITLPVQTFYLVNPHIPGMLEFRIPNESELRIDRDQKQIDGWTDTTVSVIIHDKIAI